MSNNVEFKITLPVLLTVGCIVFGGIWSQSNLYSRVSILEKNAIHTITILQRLVIMETQIKELSKQINHLIQQQHKRVK